MSTISKASLCNQTDNICQGDIFSDVKYNYIDIESDDSVEIVEFTFPMAIIISQACDVNSMGEMFNTHEGKATKFMPSILLCHIYNIDIEKKSEHIDNIFNELKYKKMGEQADVIFYGEDLKIAKKDWHYRYHFLSIKENDKTVLDNYIIDFKHYFTVPISYLSNNKGNRLFRLESLFAEQITLKFSTYLSRVAIP